MVRLFTLLFIGMTVLCSHLSAQQVISSAGGQGNTTDFSLTWTVGQPEGAVFFAGNGIISQGFQQPYLELVSVEDELNLTNALEKHIIVFPNPFHTYFEIQFPAPLNTDIQVINGLGQIVYLRHRNALSESEEQKIRIETQDWSSGIYRLVLSDGYNKNTAQTYTLIKN